MTTVKTCRHTSGFTNLNVVDPVSGQEIKVMEGNCLECGEPRYFDRHAAIYRTVQDARRGINAERTRAI